MTEYHGSVLPRLMALMLILALLLGLAPLPASAAQYGCVTKDGIFFRQKASASAGYWERLSNGWVMEILDTVEKSGITWYHVQGGVPTAPNKTYEGYVHGDFFRLLTTEETNAWLANPVQGTVSGGSAGSTGAATTTTASYIKTTTGGVNLRASADVSGTSLVSLASGAIMQVVSYSNNWYGVVYNGTAGFVSDAFVTALTQAEINAYLGTTSGSTGSYSTATVVTTGGTLTLRKSQSTGAAGLAYIPNLTVISVSEVGAKWTKATYNGQTGYVLTSYLSFGGSATTSPTNTTSPTGGTTSYSTATVVTTGGTLTLRQTQSTSAAGLAYIPNLSVITVSEVGSKWTKATYNGVTGYVLTSYLSFSGSVTASPTATAATSTSVVATVKTTGGTLTLRQTQSTSAAALTVIPNGSILTVADRGSQWCLTSYNGYTGYVLTSYLVFDSSSSSLVAYVYITTGSVNVRDAAAGRTFTTVKKGTVWPLAGSAQYKSSYTWYPISINGRIGYVRGDCALQMTEQQYNDYISSGAIPSATPTPNPNADKNSSYLISQSSTLNIRAAASTSSTSLAKIGMGDVLKYTGTTTVGSTLWYKIEYEGVSCFVMGKYVRVLTNAEYQAYIGTLPTATPTPLPTAVPDLSLMSDMAYTLKANILIRKAGNSKAVSIIKLYEAPVYLTLTKLYNTDPYNTSDVYYQVKYNGTTGWIRGDLIHIMTPAEKEAYTGGGSGTATATPTPGSTTYVKYTTLRLGSSGNDVTKLQKALVSQGYLSSSQVTGNYLTTTRTAVIAFQKAKGLSQDGVAGQKTLATLYGTPIYDTTNVDTNLYPVELVDWYTGDIQKVWSRGTIAVITDVKTGLSFKAKRWAGAYHADVEPLTAADTAIMCKIYGVSNAQAISDNNLYQRRPLWVTVGGRSFAASMYGVPHNYPDGDTISDNNFNGQFCVHFVNSRTHGTYKVDADHQAAIKYAYEHAASKK